MAQRENQKLSVFQEIDLKMIVTHRWLWCCTFSLLLLPDIDIHDSLHGN